MSAGGPSLLMDLATIGGRLEHELHQGSLLDAYLLSAAAAQITDDYLHPGIYPFDRAAAHLGKQAAPVAQLAARSAGAVAAATRAIRSRRPATTRVLQWRRELAELVDTLAETQVGGPEPAGAARGALAGRCGALIGELELLPGSLREAVVRLPACFHHFDQRPADVVSLVRRLAERSVERDRPLLAVGVRTSGNYLAPLCAASLKAYGFQDVRGLTIRPGQPLLEDERALVGCVARNRGNALLLDDPPVTGASIAAAARQLERAGLPGHAITLLLPVFGDADLPRSLRRYAALLLPFSDWAVTADLHPEAIRERLESMLGPRASLLAAEPIPLPARQPARGHVRARFRVQVAGVGAADGAPVERDVLVEGVGLGYLGAHRLIARTLVERFSPQVLGLCDGLLYRDWLPAEQRVGPVSPDDEEAVAAEVAAYVSERRLALPTDEDLTLRIEQPAWEVASMVLSRTFGRAWPLARMLLTDRATKRILRVQRPSVVDGNTDLAQWFWRDGAPSSLAKPDVGEDSFSNLSAPCFDAAYDLAGVTARADTPTLARRVRRSYAAVAGEAVDEERWMLYELVHLWNRERTQPQEAANLRRARSRILQRYFADVYLGDVAYSPDGPLCAFDIDGVLEGEHLGFSALTPAAALALRSLIAHGYRPVLASGRSLPEVSERCRAYGLFGGVAEYGTVTFQSAGGRVETLLRDADTVAALERLREALNGMADVCLDPDYRFCVRAFTLEHGQRAGLSPRASAQALAGIGGTQIQAITGDAQTDFVAESVGKGPGLRALVCALGVDGERPFSLAVGDTASDLDFAGLSTRPCAPRHADPVLRRAGFAIMPRPYQAGLAQAVGRLLGHPPGGCSVCRMSAPTPERSILQALLGTPERGRPGIALRALELGWRIR